VLRHQRGVLLDDLAVPLLQPVVVPVGSHAFGCVVLLLPPLMVGLHGRLGRLHGSVVRLHSRVLSPQNLAGRRGGATVANRVAAD